MNPRIHITTTGSPMQRARPSATRPGLRAAVLGAAVALVVVPAGAAVADQTASIGRSAGARPQIEPITLGCEAEQPDDVASITCRWSVPSHPDVAGVRLIRAATAGEAGRTTVFRTGDANDNSFVDNPVRAGVRYVYAVRVFDAAGRLLGASRPVSVGVRIEQPNPVEVLRLDCEQVSGIRVSCAWSDPQAGGRVLTLWRSVDAAPRERVASFSNPFPSAYVDGVPNGSSTVAYAVTVVDGAGDIVARTRADLVRLRTVESSTTTSTPDTRPVNPRPVEDRPVETRPVETRPVDTRPPETRAVDTRPVETPPAGTRPVETRPVDTRPEETRPTTTVAAEPHDDSTRSGEPGRTGRTERSDD